MEGATTPAQERHGAPELTVAICTHDNAPMLERALERLAAQRVSPATRWELVVVDNRSGDATPGLLREVAERGTFPAMRAVREERLGLAHARRRALAEARADVVAFVDDDCLLDPGWVEAALAFARARPRAGAFGGRVDLRWEAPPSAIAEACAWALAKQDHGPAPVMLPARGGGSLVGAGLVVRRQALEDSGWHQRGQMLGRTGKALTSGDDAEIGLRIRAAGWELWYEPAMRLEHVIPEARTRLDYLARLHRAIGRTAPHIAVVSGEHRRGPLSRLYFCYRGLVKAANKLLHAAFHAALGRRLRAEQKWLQAQYWYGCFLGGLELAPSGELALPAPAGAPRISAPGSGTSASSTATGSAGSGARCR
jgi:glycosyltransferase involved in cell wall biosynthesis